MKILIAILVLGGAMFVMPKAHACSCTRISGSVETWAKDISGSSAYVFLGTIKSVRPEAEGDDLQITVSEQFKGKFGGNAKTRAMCQNFTVVPGDTRVFFVGADGNVRSCSDYKSYFSDLVLRKALRQILGTGT